MSINPVVLSIIQSSGLTRLQQPSPGGHYPDRVAGDLHRALLAQRDQGSSLAGGLLHPFLQGTELAVERLRVREVGADLDQLPGAPGTFRQEVDLVAGAGRDVRQGPSPAPELQIDGGLQQVAEIPGSPEGEGRREGWIDWITLARIGLPDPGRRGGDRHRREKETVLKMGQVLVQRI